MPLPSPSLLDAPTALLGDSIWREALGDQISLLDALAQAGGAHSLNRLQSMENDTPELRVIELSALVTDLIGMDVARSTVVTSTSDGVMPLRSTMHPRRARHTHDDQVAWFDTDGCAVTSFEQLLLLPDVPRFVAEDTAAWQTWWVCACPEDLGEVVAIRVPTGVLLAGLDFYRSLDRLLFRQHPAVLFADGIIRACVREVQQDNVGYSVRMERSMAAIQATAEIMRSGPTLKRLQHLADVMTGVVVLPESGTVQQRKSLPNGTRYVMDTFDVVVPYDHPEVAVGAWLPAGYKFGETIRLVEQGTQGPNWWRALNLSAGVSLDEVCPVKGVRIPAESIRAVSFLDGSVVRVRLDVLGEPEQVRRYQAFCLAVERRKTSQLTTLLGVTTAGQTLYVDGLDLLFRHVLGRRVIMVLLRPGAPRRILQTLRNLAPLSTCLISHQIPDEQDWMATAG